MIVALEQAVVRYPPNQRAINGIDLQIQSGEFTAIYGCEGSGKTTLLRLLSGMILPCSGSVRVLGNALEQLSERQRARFRNRHIGLLEGNGVLLPDYTVEQNIALPLSVQGMRVGVRRKQVRELAQALGLMEVLQAYPSALSAYSHQCALLARALVTDPALVLADEPLLPLNSKRAGAFFDCLQRAANGRTLIIFTDDMRTASKAQRTITLQHGTILEAQK